MKKKKLSSIAIIILGIMLVVTGCGKAGTKAASSNEKQTLIPVKFGVGGSGTLPYLFLIANEKGFFEKRGIKPELTTFANGVETLNAAVVGQVDVGVAADYAVLSRLSSGDLRIISFAQQGKPENSKLVALPGINSPEDLKGKSIGLQKGTVDEVVVYKYLEKFNIKQDEVKKQGLGSASEVLAAFSRGDVKAAFFGAAWLDKALKIPGARVIGSQKDIPFSSRAFIVTTNKLLKEKPDAAKRMLLALNDAVKFSETNPDEAAQIQADKLKVPKESLERQLKDQINDIRLSSEDIKQLKDVYDYATSNNLIKGGFDLKDKIATEPLKQALPSKFTYNPDDLK
ncbi:MAG: ABC transporter substrate-binding protein [Clostridium sp.]|uniref:ABC transporter substrate-binding protein n=1 Tax=Clostridium sp. TaxID=1506 RepID=UPI0039E7E6D9